MLAHAGFVGMMSNLLFGVLSERTTDAPLLNEWAEPSAMWVLNIGLLAFLGGKITMDVRHGALVMGIGAVLGVGVMLYRLVQQ